MLAWRATEQCYGSRGAKAARRNSSIFFGAYSPHRQLPLMQTELARPVSISEMNYVVYDGRCGKQH